MSYDSVEEGLLNIVRKAIGFNIGNTTRGDYRILSESQEKFVVLTPGPIRGRRLLAAPRYIETIWVVNLELFIPYQDDLSEVWKLLRTSRQNLLDVLDAYPRLDSAVGVNNAFAEGALTPEVRRGSGRRWWFQVLQVAIEERAIVTILE
jgi:hypothetical protein